MQPDGATLRQHLQAVERQTGRKPAQLEMPDLPVELSHAWNWFLELHQRRTYSERGPNPVAWPDLLAWREIRGKRPTQFEWDCLLSLDGAFFSSLNQGVDGNDG